MGDTNTHILHLWSKLDPVYLSGSKLIGRNPSHLFCALESATFYPHQHPL